MRPLTVEDTSTASKIFTDGGSRKLANHLRLPIMFVADLNAYGPLARKAMNRKSTPRRTGKSGAPKYEVKVM